MAEARSFARERVRVTLRHSHGATDPSSASSQPIPSHFASGQAEPVSARRIGTTVPPSGGTRGGRLRAGSEVIYLVTDRIAGRLELVAGGRRRIHVTPPRQVLELRIGREEGQLDVPDGPVAVLGDDDVRLAAGVLVGIVLVVLLAEDEADDVRVLLQVPRLAKRSEERRGG